MTKVYNEIGHEVSFEAAANMMDDELRENVAAQGIDDAQAFFEAYADLHSMKFGEGFAPYTGEEW